MSRVPQVDEDDTYLLIANLHLRDVEEVNTGRKGKARDNAPLNDEELAFQLQTEILRNYLTELVDRRLALSIGDALDSDHDLLESIRLAEQGVEDDHRYAAALSFGQPLPEKSQAQLFLEGSPKRLGKAKTLPPTPEEYISFDDYYEAPEAAAAGSLTQASSSTYPISKATVVECAICCEHFGVQYSFHAPCNHYYCVDCLSNLVKACTTDETLYPLRCCQQPFSLDIVLPLLDQRTRTQFQVKDREFGTPTADRLYCANPSCSIFLGSTKTLPYKAVACRQCGTSVCTKCKDRAHGNELCGESTSLLQVKALAQERGWQTCPGCRNIVELHRGCNHMTCRCRTEFCYICAVRWKNCSCPQWDEDHLLETAELRVQNEIEHRGPREAAEVQRRVVMAVEQLRVEHACYPHRWQYRSGGGNCEECGFYLPLYLLACTGCRMLACVRCTRNRL